MKRGMNWRACTKNLSSAWGTLAAPALLLLFAAGGGGCKPQKVTPPTELVIAIDDDRGGNVNPYSGNFSPVVRLLAGSLLRADSHGNLHPRLAKRIQIEDASLLIELSAGAKFSDGTAVKAEDVVASLNAHADARIQGPNVAALAALGYRTATAEGEHKVRVTFDKMLADTKSFIAQLSIWPASLVEFIQRAKEPADAKVDWRTLAGAGAYRVLECEPNSYALLVPIEKGERIRVRVVGDKDTARAEFAAGHIHLAYAEPRRQGLYRKIKGAQVVPYEYPMPVSLAMNMEPGTPTGESLKLRQAIGLVTQIEPLRQLVAKEGSVLAKGRLFLGPIAEWNDPDAERLMPTFDPKAAARLLDTEFPVRDGLRRLKDGTPFRLVIVSYQSTEYPQLAERLALEWRKHLNVDAVAHVAPPGRFNDIVNRLSRDLGPKDWHVLLEEWPHELAPFTPSRGASLLSTAIPPTGDNLIGLQDTQIDDWIREADRCLDSKERRDLYRRVHRRLLEQHYVLPMYVVHDSWVVRPEVTGIDKDDPLVRQTIFSWPESLGLSAAGRHQ